MHLPLSRTLAILNVVFFVSAEDVMMETVVEVSTECGPIEEDSFPIASECEPAAKKKRGGGCQCGISDFPRLTVKLESVIKRPTM